METAQVIGTLFVLVGSRRRATDEGAARRGRQIRWTDAGRRRTIQALSIGAALLAATNADPAAADEDDELIQRRGQELMASGTMAIAAASAAAAAAGGPLLQKRDRVADGISDD
ncbi:hypothetical protein ACLOJK_023141 [Asimina triloba]